MSDVSDVSLDTVLPPSVPDTFAYPVPLEEMPLSDADPDCEHDVQADWSGVKCTKCRGRFLSKGVADE